MSSSSPTQESGLSKQPHITVKRSVAGSNVLFEVKVNNAVILVIDGEVVGPFAVNGSDLIVLGNFLEGDENQTLFSFP
jgi:hypothetical protein